MMHKQNRRPLPLLLTAAILVALVILIVRIHSVQEYRTEVLRMAVPDYDDDLSYNGYMSVTRDYYWNRRSLIDDDDKLPGDFLAAYMEDLFFYRAYEENGMTEKAAQRKQSMEEHLSRTGAYASHEDAILERMGRR